jgi:D-beta-D-heptose 7-phosphate kinase/D-beta-D-heptose 1-phosphate adenosyltransferase
MKILVVGDSILDNYRFGSVDRISQESSVPIHEYSHEEFRYGGAANVAANLVSFGHEVTLLSSGLTVFPPSLGHDFEMTSLSIDSRPDTKIRYVSENHGKYDYVFRADIPGNLTEYDLSLDAFKSSVELFIQENDPDWIVISNYNKGFLDVSKVEFLLNTGCRIAIDPKDILRGVREFPNLPEIVKVNREEYLNYYREVGLRLKNFIVTKDKSGMSYCAHLSNRVWIGFPVDPIDTVDITGCGDVALAALVDGWDKGYDYACERANTIAGWSATQFGTTVVPKSVIRLMDDKVFHNVNEVLKCLEYYKVSGKKIVYTNGCFDIFHKGHKELLEKAKSLGDFLVVGLNTDDSIKILKGEDRPVNSFEDRAYMLKDYADMIIKIETTPMPSIFVIKPDILIKGHTSGEIVGKEFVESYGGLVVKFTSSTDISTTELLNS